MPLKLTIKVKACCGSCTAYRRQCCQMYFDGLDGRTCRGMDAIDTGEGIKVPVGEETLGRIFNVLGDAVDNMPNPETKEKWCIHREPPTYEEQNPTTEYLKRVLRLSTLLRRMQKAVKSVFSAVQGSARLFL